MNLPDRQRQFVDFLNEHRKMFFKLAYVYCRHQDERKDLIQEMLVQLWRSFETFDGRVKFSTWAYRVAANTAISYHRSAKKSRHELISIDELGIDLESANSVFEESTETMHTLRTLLEKLDELNSTLILLYLDGCSHEEIADTIGISVSNVGTRISRIKKTLKESLGVS